MKFFLKIKHIKIYPDDDMVIVLRSGVVVVKNGKDYIVQNTGEVLTPLWDEFTDELVGFIGPIK